MSTTGLIILIIIRCILSVIYKDQSVLCFYMISLIFIYTLKLGVETFLLTNYNRKNCILIALCSNLFFYFLYYTFDGF